MRRSASVLIALLLSSVISSAATTTIDFEALTDFESVTNQYSGVTFTNALTLIAGISLNEAEFPPASGIAVIFDDGAPMRIDFSVPVSFFSARFNYLLPITVQGFRSGVEIASVISQFGTNQGLSGDPGSAPNELLQIADAIGFARIVITGTPDGGSFTLDDLSYEPSTQQVIPEPSTLALFGIALTAGFLHSRKRQS